MFIFVLWKNQLFQHFVITVLYIEVHVVPIVHSYTFMALRNMMKPKTR
jgi:hypothetical protein